MIASYVYQGRPYTVELERQPDGTYNAVIDGATIPVRIPMPSPTGRP